MLLTSIFLLFLQRCPLILSLLKPQCTVRRASPSYVSAGVAIMQAAPPEAVADVLRKLPIESLRRIIELAALKDEGVRELVRRRRCCAVSRCSRSGHKPRGVVMCTASNAD